MMRNRCYWTAAGVTVAIVAAVSLGLASTAGSHLRDGQGRWYFRGFTAGQDDGSSKSDPVNVLFYRGGPYR